MERGGEREQDPAKVIEKEPHEHRATEDLQHPHDPGKAERSRRRRLEYFLQTGGTENTIFMFSDTLPAKIEAAFRAARNGLTEFVVAAAPMKDIIHLRHPRKRIRPQGMADPMKNDDRPSEISL